MTRPDPMMRDPILRAEEITKRFQGVLALDRVDFSLRSESVHALVGQNGAGKSTLINVLMGVMPRDGGKVFLDDKEVHFESTSDALEHGLASIYQESFVVGDMSIADNVFLGDTPTIGWTHRVDVARMRRESDAIFERMGVALPVERLARGLGTADQQLVMIARALRRESRILVLDEPTASLDRNEIENLFGIIHNLVSDGCAVIYISHYLDEIFEIADEVTILRDGRSVASASTDDLDQAAVVEHMLGASMSSTIFAQRAEPGPVVLEVRGISTGSRLDNVSLTLREGEVVGLAGILGSGRTEVVRAIFGADRLTSGQILIDGRSLSIKSPSDAVQLGIGLVTEERYQGTIPGFSVASNITLASLKQVSRGVWLRKRYEKEIASTYVERLGIKASSIEQTVSTLSGGNQQKVILAKWLQSQARILLLDEPTQGIDVGAKAEILEMIADLAGQGIAIVLVSSEFDDLVQVCDRILIMKRGRVAQELTETVSGHFLQAEVGV